MQHFLRLLAPACAALATALLLSDGFVARGIASENDSQFTLVDVTEKTGISFRHTSVPEKKYIVESMSGGVALIDFDRDGRLDIYFTNAPSVEMALAGQSARSALYRNNGDWTFTDVTDRAGVGAPGWAMGAAVGDFDNDSWPDLYVTCFGPDVLYRNNGNGTFTDATRRAKVGDPRWSTGAAFGDYDADGWLDLFVTNYVDFQLNDLPSFGKAKTCQYRGIDVQCGPRGLKGAGDTLYHNNRDGTFSDVSQATGTHDPNGYYGMQVVWSDLDDDGRLDAYVANDATPKFLYRNEGGGKFKEMGFLSGAAVNQDGSEQASMGIAVGDYRREGRFSLYVTNFSEEYNTLYRNDGGMSFSDVSFAARIGLPTLPHVGWGTGFVDFDNDGWLDLFVVNGHVYPQVDTVDVGTKYRQPRLLFGNNGNGTFRDLSSSVGTALGSPRVSRGAAFGDLDNDGDVDIVIEDLDATPVLLRNDGGNRNHWLRLELLGAQSNRLAIGARVKITSGGASQIDEVRGGSSYLSQNDLRLHFGLGASERVDQIEIRWPTGRTQTLTNLAADREYIIREGEGVVKTRTQ